MITVLLKVPFSANDRAKFLGARWNSDKKTWYITFDPARLTDEIRSLITNWMSDDNKHRLTCPREHFEYAVQRGAFLEPDATSVFIPHGYPQSSEGRYVLYRLPYWLPEHPEFLGERTTEFRKTFSSHEEAATNIANNGSYMPRDFFLPEEREAMERSCSRGSGWYLMSAHSEFAYYRHQIWDTW
jgi:hypothetical protein